MTDIAILSARPANKPEDADAPFKLVGWYPKRALAVDYAIQRRQTDPVGDQWEFAIDEVPEGKTV